MLFRSARVTRSRLALHTTTTGAGGGISNQKTNFATSTEPTLTISSDVASAAARIRAAAAGLRSASRYENPDLSYGDPTVNHVTGNAKKKCNRIRKISQVSRTLCAIKNNLDGMNIKVLKAEISKTHSTSVTKLGASPFEMPYVDVFTNLLDKNVPKAAMKVATPSF